MEKKKVLIQEEGKPSDELTAIEIGADDLYDHELEIGQWASGLTTDEIGNEIEAEGTIVEVL